LTLSIRRTPKHQTNSAVMPQECRRLKNNQRQRNGRRLLLTTETKEPNMAY